MSVDVLDRELYSQAEAAQILRVAPTTLQWWLDGGTRRGRTYPPVIRPAPTGRSTVTWAEFVQAGLLREYRRDLGVKRHELRHFIDELRAKEGAPYPLAHYRPWVGEGKRLLLELQETTDLPGELCLVAVTNGQLILTPAAESFFRRVKWDGDLPSAWRPHQDDASPVRCSPERRFGRPEIKGISTEIILEHLDAVEDEDSLAEQFGLELDDVRGASAFELSRHSLAA